MFSAFTEEAAGGPGPETPFANWLQTPAANARTNVGAHERALARTRHEAYAAGREAGYKDGFEHGLLEGGALGEKSARAEVTAELRAAFDAEIKEFRAQFQKKIDALNAALPAFFADAEDAMADRAVEVVRRLLASELTQSRESVLAIVRETLGEITVARHARVVVNPFDHPVIEAHRTEILRMAASLRDFDIVEDPSILGGCRIETDGGSVDATLGLRLDNYEQAYREAS